MFNNAFGIDSIGKQQNFAPLQILSTRSITSQYFSLDIEEIALGSSEDVINDARAIGGGTIVPFGPEQVLHINSSGSSTLIDLGRKIYAFNKFPQINLGLNQFSETKFYNLIKTAPRVLGAAD